MRRRTGRGVDGILLLDKPPGMSSNAALQCVRRLFNARKAGHTGSLDPLATGMLPLCFGEATKLSGLLLDADKRYRVSLTLGARTDTADADGAVVEQAAWQHVDSASVQVALPQFIGAQSQVPPMYSALKQGGERLYDLARRGIEVERKSRDIVIHAIRLLALAGNELTLEVHCSKGTYIRVLGEDIAAALGTLAHVRLLRRLSVGPFSGAMWSLDTLQQRLDEGGTAALDAALLPPEAALQGWPSVMLDAAQAQRIRRGQTISCTAAPTCECLVLLQENAGFIGIGTASAGQLRPRRLLATGHEAA